MLILLLGTKIPGDESFWQQRFQGTKVSRNRSFKGQKFPRTKVPRFHLWNFRCWEQNFSGTKVPWIHVGT